jgi:hypothetical protein
MAQNSMACRSIFKEKMEISNGKCTMGRENADGCTTIDDEIEIRYINMYRNP